MLELTTKEEKKMAKNYIDSPNNPPGNAGDYAGSGGNAGKPYDSSAGLADADGGIIPFKGLETVKGDDFKIDILSPAVKGH